MTSAVDVDCLDDAEQRMRDLAAAAYPDEGCGVLVGRRVDGRVQIHRVTSARNLNEERSRDRYVMDPGDIVRADREARVDGLDIVGFWHSHPDHPARPSQFDTDHAWAEYVYVICHTSREGTGDVNAFTLDDERGEFVPLLLITVPRNPTPAP
jgi:proteasome lid subunit RPN8/RPN11